MSIRVHHPGLFTTIQDLGRFGYAHLGVSPAGAADPLSARVANLLVGNPDNTAALEMTLMGATLEFEESALAALTGADSEAKLGSIAVPLNAAIEIPAGGVLQCGRFVNGVRCYLAVQGGFDVPLVMGSASTDIRGGFGGFSGRRLRAGDLLDFGNARTSHMRNLHPGALKSLHRHGPIRVTRGAQHEGFLGETFYSSVYTVSEQSDRAGVRLQGPPLSSSNPSELLTEGIPLGAIQIPPDGQPIILFVDQQTTGGYPKIANVIAADLHRIGQLRPRDQVRFAEVSITEAVQALREQGQRLLEMFE